LVGSIDGVESNLKLIHFSDIEEKFYATDSGVIILYNLDLTEYKRLNYEAIYGNDYWETAIVNISDKLFNSDSKIEFLLCHYGNSDGTKIETIVINEDGEIIFKAQDRQPARAVGSFGSYSVDDCIFNTQNGNYLQLINAASDGSYSYSEVYSLPGNLPNEVKETYSKNSNNDAFEVISEPSKKIVSVYFTNNYSKEKRGLLYIRDISGKTIKSVKIDAQKQDVDVSDLNIGSYIFSYKDGDQVMNSKKIVLY